MKTGVGGRKDLPQAEGWTHALAGKTVSDSVVVSDRTDGNLHRVPGISPGAGDQGL